MPTFEKHPFVARAPPVTLKPESEVFYLKATAEIFTSYEDYVRRLAHLRAKHWSCSLTGRSNLSFEEALQSERSAKEQIAKVRRCA